MTSENNFWKPIGFGEQIFKQRYAIHPEETWDAASRRVAKLLASAEQPQKLLQVEDEIYNALAQGLICFGGRVLRNAGRPKPALINCFHTVAVDSREGWGELIANVLIVSGTGGGLGIDFSQIRPRGSRIRGTGGYASGAVSLAKICNEAAEQIKDGGGRRAALLASLPISKGDIEEFLNSKLNLNELNNMNISVVFDSQLCWEQFVELVDNNGDIVFYWGEEKLGKIKAQKLYDMLLENNLKMGEPGFLNLHLANELNNLYYCSRITGTNPCAEIICSDKGSCVLGALVLPNFYVPETNDLNWDLMGDTIHTLIRALDNVVEINYYPTSDYQRVAKQERVLGASYMGFASLLLQMGIRYGSAEMYKILNKIGKFFAERAYEASTYLAAEKGVFPLYEREKFLQSRFVLELPSWVQKRIAKYGMRNGRLLTMPPHGTTSQLMGVSAGIAPNFSAASKRRYYEQCGNKDNVLKEEIVFAPLFREYYEQGKDLTLFASYLDVTLETQFKAQSVAQKWIDNSVSNTIWIISEFYPQYDFPEEIEELIKQFNYKIVTKTDLDKLLRKYMPLLKGITFYPLGSRDKKNNKTQRQPIVPLPLDEAIQLIQNEGVVNSATEEIDINPSCKNGVCEV